MRIIKEQVTHLEKCRTLPAWSKVPPWLKMKVNAAIVESRRYLPKEESEKQGDL